MALILRSTFNWLYDLYANDQGSDLSHLPLAGSMLPLLSITALYLLFVLKLGPLYMRDRPPFQIKRLILVYNVVQVLLNAYITIASFLLLHVPGHYDFGCIGKLPPSHSLYALCGQLTYLYYLNKLMDYLDTIFFVLRKSFKQISFLHVYHHVIMTIIPYGITHYYGSGGHHYFVGQLNAFVHVLMYSYYYLSAVRPEIKNSKWKRYITNVQILQFVALMIHQAWPLLVRTDCAYPKPLSALTTLQAFVMLWLFSNFYLQTYLRNRRKSGAQQKQKHS